MITCLQKNTKGDYPIKFDDVIIDDDVISDEMFTHEQKIIKNGVIVIPPYEFDNPAVGINN
jgi:hypothetical protein